MIHLLHNRIFKNSSWIIGEKLFQMVLSLFVGVLTARYLGPSNYGTLNYTASFVAFCTAIATLGMDGVAVKKIVDHPEDEGAYLGGCILFRLVASLLCSVSISVVVFLLNPDEPIKLILVLIQSMQLVLRSVHILDSWFQRYLLSKYTSLGKMAATLVVYTYKIYLLVTAKSIVWFAVSNVLGDAVISLVLLWFYSREKHYPLQADLNKGSEVLSQSYHFILSGLMVAIYSQMDKIMIGQMLDDTDVGLYTTATAVCGMWIFIPTAIITSFQPQIMELKSAHKEAQYLIRLKQLYCGIIWLCISVSIVVTVFGRLIIWILYGPSYMGAVGVLRIAIWFETFAMIGTARGIWILCENKNKYVKYYLAVGAVVNLILNYILIPTYGINGAAFATLVTQITTSMIAPLLFSETREHTKIVMQAFLFQWQ